MPTPTTIGDLIAAEETAETNESAALAQQDAANKAVVAAHAAKLAASAALGTGLGAVGTTFLIESDGTAEIFTPDGQGGFHKTVANPASTPLPGAAVPTAPEPAPAPTA